MPVHGKMFDVQNDGHHHNRSSSSLVDMTFANFPSSSSSSSSCVSSRRAQPASPSRPVGMTPPASSIPCQHEHKHKHEQPSQRDSGVTVDTGTSNTTRRRCCSGKGESTGDSGSSNPVSCSSGLQHQAPSHGLTTGTVPCAMSPSPPSMATFLPLLPLSPALPPPPPPENSEQPPKVSLEEFALRYHLSQRKLSHKKNLESRLLATKVSIGISARLVHIGAVAQRGLVESLKHDDKLGFVTIYQALHDIQESCDSASLRRHLLRQDPLDDWSQQQQQQQQQQQTQQLVSPGLDRSPGFFPQLSPQSRSDLLEILRLARTDSQFLFTRLCSLTQPQLAVLLSSSAPSLDAGDIVLLSSSSSSSFSASRSRNRYSFSKRNNVSHSALFKDYAFGLERADPLSALIFNIFAAPLDSDAPEARLRLDVWSSVCARLFSHGGSRYYPLIGHILSSWSMCSEWKAKSKFELYLMDTLQAGAFLLEHIDTPSGLNFDAEPPDPLRTDVAEEFFTSAVNSLFALLDDPDAGFPHTVMEFASAVLRKLDHPGIRDHFLEFLFVQWFYSKFLYGVLTYPETHGLLLDFHISKDAREKLLGQVGLQAHTQVFSVLRSMPNFSSVLPEVRKHVESMLLRFHSASVPPRTSSDGSSRIHSDAGWNSAVFLMLSATDVLTILNSLFPRAPSPLYSPPGTSSGIVSTHSLSPFQSYNNEKTTQSFESGFFRPNTGSSATATSTTTKYPAGAKTVSPSSDMDFLSLPVNSLFQNADRIRFELSDMGELDGRSGLDNPSTEDWAIFSVPGNGGSLTCGLSPNADNQSSSLFQDSHSVVDVQSTALGVEDNYEALQTAVVKLVEEGNISDYHYDGLPRQGASHLMHTDSSSFLKQNFDRAALLCHQDSDFLGAHYWWNASRQLLHGTDNFPSRFVDDSWVLGPMYASCTQSLDASRSVIERYENDFVVLDRNMQRLQSTVNGFMATMGRLRNKMWYMTDVKNSMRYEDAKNVALALKTMAYSAHLFKQPPQSQPRTRSSGTRSLAGSLLQKPELQVMDIIKAASSQGGPNKLSDEQVDLTRKWLSHNGIDNFCRGEERIHRFCYEVKTSINRLVGETMAETPVLWASELFQKERARFEGYSSRRVVSMPPSASSSIRRPPSITCDDAVAQIYGTYPRKSESVSRLPLDTMPLARQTSFQSLESDKWRSPKDFFATDSSSIGDSPGRGSSTSTTTTTEACSTLWSAPHAQTQYTASTPSLYSRPPSLFSDTAAAATASAASTTPPRRVDRNAHEKVAFLHDMRQALASLLLSDLGSPVWSCGSETDAWFFNALNRSTIQSQMQKRAKIQRFYAEYEDRSSRRAASQTSLSNSLRSTSLGPDPLARRHRGAEGKKPEPASSPVEKRPKEGKPPFSYRTAFSRLLEVFSRNANPFVKLNALRDLRLLVIMALNTSTDDKPQVNPSGESACESVRRSRAARHSFSGSRTRETKRGHGSQTLASPAAAESVMFGSRPSDFIGANEKQIVDILRGLIHEIKPRTLFRDLQFISAFVPGEVLDKTDGGTAFLQFGLAALSLKDEVCNSMVEIADNIVAQELSRRHHPHDSSSTNRSRQGIEDAAGMWIITAKEGNPVGQRELAILYLTHPELLPRVTFPLTLPRDTFKAEMMYHRDKDPKSDPQSMCLALHWMHLSATGGDELARNRLREREEFDSIA